MAARAREGVNRTVLGEEDEGRKLLSAQTAAFELLDHHALQAFFQVLDAVPDGAKTARGRYRK